MGKQQFLKSLVSGDVKYVSLQARATSDGLHVQGSGASINRSYGVAVDLAVSEEVRAWVNAQTPSQKSLVSDRRYVPIQATVYPGSEVHIQVAGSKLNRNYGMVLKTRNPELLSFVNKQSDAIRTAANAEAKAKAAAVAKAKADADAAAKAAKVLLSDLTKSAVLA